MKDAWRHFAAEFVGVFALTFIGTTNATDSTLYLLGATGGGVCSQPRGRARAPARASPVPSDSGVGRIPLRYTARAPRSHRRSGRNAAFVALISASLTTLMLVASIPGW